MLQETRGPAAGYQDADLVLADGWPVVAASRLLGKPLPSRVAGADLVPSLFAGHTGRIDGVLAGSHARGRRASSTEHRSAMAAGACRWHATARRWVSNAIGSRTFTFSSNWRGRVRTSWWSAWERPSRSCGCINTGCRSARKWLCARARRSIFWPATRGARHDWIQAVGMEWCHRMLSEPRRLARRYARDAWVFPQLVWQEWYQTIKRA